MSKRKFFGEIPREVSENIKAPETAPSDKRFTGRTKQLNFKVREKFYWQLKNRAIEEKCMMVEVLERVFAEYEQDKQAKAEKELENHVKVIEHKPKPQKKPTSYSHINFTCDSCGDEYKQDIAYSYAPSFKELNRYQTYCGGCVE